MERFTRHEGLTAPLLIDNVNTDQIIPSREMKRVSKDGLGEGLFANMRYADAAAGGRTPNPDFVLNQDAHRDASILVSGKNFGCGSSREHAAWALHEFGIRAIIAESFGAIFHDNCIANGILPVVLQREHIERLASQGAVRIVIDLGARSLETPDAALPFELEDSKRALLLAGLKPIDLVMQHRDEIDRFIAADRSARPWVYDHPAHQAEGDS